MSTLRVLPAALALSLALVACQSAEQKADTDEVKVGQGVEAVCAAQTDVDEAVATVNALTRNPRLRMRSKRATNSRLLSPL